MGLLDRLRGDTAQAEPAADNSFAGDARSMRTTLDAMNAERAGALDLRAIVQDLLDGEVAAPTRDIASLRREGVDAGDSEEQPDQQD